MKGEREKKQKHVQHPGSMLSLLANLLVAVAVVWLGSLGENLVAGDPKAPHIRGMVKQIVVVALQAKMTGGKKQRNKRKNETEGD